MGEWRIFRMLKAGKQITSSGSLYFSVNTLVLVGVYSH